jgi:hypothetical protein
MPAPAGVQLTEVNAALPQDVDMALVRNSVSHAFQRWRICPFPVEEVIGRLRSAMEAASFWNLHEIDSQALLSHEGYAISPARQLLFFHPRPVVRILTLIQLLCSRCL